MNSPAWKQVLDDLEHRCGNNTHRWPTSRRFETDRGVLMHCRWMVGEMRKMSDSGKAMRWLCWVQGALATLSRMTVDEQRAQNTLIIGEAGQDSEEV